METYKAIITRRSIRTFIDKPIDDLLLEKILKAGMYAPSARNLQPWHFILCTRREILDKIPEAHPHAKMCYEAQAAVVVCGDLSIEPSVEYNAINCSAATQNILLAAHELGLGSVWLGVYPRPDRVEGITRLFKLPHDIVPVSIVALGYPGEEKEIPDRFNKDRIHLNKW
jgi:nitroreductase